MDNTRINRANNTIVIIEPQAHYYEVQRWRHSHKNKEKAEKQKIKKALAKSCREIVATFYSEKGYMLTMRRIHRKMLHLASGGVVEGFVTAPDKHFSSVTTDAFNAELKAIDVYLKDYSDNRNCHLKKCWQVVPTIEALQDDERAG